MWTKLRITIAKRVLRPEYKQLDDLRKMYAKRLNEEVDAAQAFRQQMNGFDPKLLDVEDDLEVIYDTEEDGLESFLAEIVALSNNKSLQEVLTVLKRNQIKHIALETQNIEQVNFGRATVNGLMLLEEEIQRLTAIYKERHQKDEEYDPSELV